MKIHKESLFNLSYVILFPLCFYYFYLANLGVFHLFLGGYISFVSIVLVLPCSILSYIGLERSAFDKKKMVEHLFLAFLVYYFIVFSINVILNDLAYENMVNHMANLIYFLLIFTIFKNMNTRSKLFIRINSALLYGWLALSFSNFLKGKYLLYIEGANLSGGHVSYQLLGLIYLVVVNIFLENEKIRLKRLVLMVLSLVFLFFNGARSELFAFIVTAPIIEYLKTNKKSYFLASSLMVLCILVFLIIIYWNEISLLDSRVIDLIVNRSESSSAVERFEDLEKGLVIIDNSVLFGGMSQYPSNEYIHNFLSVWQDLGLFGVFLYVSFITIPLVSAFRAYLERRENFNDILVVALGVAIILLLIFSKAYFYLLVPVYIGIFCNRKTRLKKGLI